MNNLNKGATSSMYYQKLSITLNCSFVYTFSVSTHTNYLSV